MGRPGRARLACGRPGPSRNTVDLRAEPQPTFCCLARSGCWSGRAAAVRTIAWRATACMAKQVSRGPEGGRVLLVRSACLKCAVAFVATRQSVRRRSPLVQRETASVSSVSIGPNSRRQHLVEASRGRSEARSSPHAGPTALPIQEQQYLGRVGRPTAGQEPGWVRRTGPSEPLRRQSCRSRRNTQRSV